MKYRFFNPYIGSKYDIGINRKKVLVVGASFYCRNVDCVFFEECTSVSAKDSSPYNILCPEYKDVGKDLQNEPSYTVEEAPTTYKRFISSISRFTKKESYSDIWSHLAFTNYVQFFLPSSSNGYRKTQLKDLSERDFEAFIETLKELQPDVVIIWGCVIKTRLIEKNIYVVDEQELSESGGYLCHMRVPGLDKIIALLNPYHPSSSRWFSHLSDFEKHLNSVLSEGETIDGEGGLST